MTLTGCSGGASMSVDMTPASDMGRGPTDHPPQWQIVNNGGPSQTAPKVYVVVWPGSEQLGKDASDFVDFMLKSAYWKNALGEYGVGAGASLGVLVLGETAPPMVSDADVKNKISAIAQGRAADMETQFALLVPPTTQVTTRFGNGCTDILGYHGYVGRQGPFYSVNIMCQPPPEGTGFDTLTQTLSHEIAEAATDLIPDTGYAASSPITYEISDLCAFNAGIPLASPAGTYWVQRQYSGRAAKDPTQDPCQPLPWNRPYWNVAVDPPVLSTGVAAPATVKARLDVFAYGDVGEIHWFFASPDGNAIAHPSKGVAHAGDTIPIEIDILAGAPSVTEVDIESASEKAGSQWWFSYVKVP